MRDHREGQDATPVDITERIRQVRDRIPFMPGRVRRVSASERQARAQYAAAKERLRQQPVSKRSAPSGKAAKILRGQR